MTHRILFVEDEPNYHAVMTLLLADLDVTLVHANDGVEALQRLEEGDIDLVISDVNMPRMNGLELLAAMRQRGLQTPVVVVTAYSSVDSAVQVMQAGALDYLSKPFAEDRLLLTLRRALQMSDLIAENRRLRDDVLGRFDFQTILGESDALVRALQSAGKMAASDATVLVRGESGTGKELVARAIHYNSKRRAGPFVAVNCAALPDALLEAELFGAEVGAYTGAVKKRRGRVELARGGTLFLDEIGDMPLVLQAKLLRLLQERTFTPLGSEHDVKADVRFVFATHKDLDVEVRAGRFRDDLRYRVSVLPLELPPLRARGDDVLLIARHTMARVCESMGKKPVTLSKRAQQALLAHPFPGNVRELNNVLERAIILLDGDELDVDDLELEPLTGATSTTSAFTPTTTFTSTSDPARTFTLPTEGLSLDELERSLVQQALARTHGNKSKAARLLGLSRATLRYRIEKMGLGDVDDA